MKKRSRAVSKKGKLNKEKDEKKEKEKRDESHWFGRAAACRGSDEHPLGLFRAFLYTSAMIS